MVGENQDGVGGAEGIGQHLHAAPASPEPSVEVPRRSVRPVLPRPGKNEKVGAARNVRGDGGDGLAPPADLRGTLRYAAKVEPDEPAPQLVELVPEAGEVGQR